MINYTGYNTSYLYDNSSYFDIGQVKTITAQEIIKSFCDNFKSFLIMTFIIISILYIIHEIISITKYKSHNRFLSFETMLFHFMGVFCCYEAYYFLTSNLDKNTNTIINYLLAVMILIFIFFVSRKIYKEYKEPK